MIDEIKRLSVKIPIYEYYDLLIYLEKGIYFGREEYVYEVDLDKHGILIFKFIKTKILAPNLIIKVSLKDKLTGIKEQIKNYCFVDKEDLGLIYQFEFNKLKIYFKFDIDIENKVDDKDIFIEAMLNRFESIRLITEVRNLLNCSDFRNEWDLIEFSYIALQNIDYIHILSNKIIDKLEYYGIDEEYMVNDVNDENKFIEKISLKHFLNKSKYLLSLNNSNTLNKEIVNLFLEQLYNQNLSTNTHAYKTHLYRTSIKEKISKMYIYHLKVIADEICK